ncbi:GPI ethanolamine phosphate transferase 2 [Coffea eugenioides]|uniref:Uncharacterized protein isoform X1 n=3 Tax=Coffea arabica TaxID=13443 RepID=A0A6P6TGL5_COFAR|nr:GPI ethanolamine phosphate transferase 2-like isoform X1 [Coffea arabica]XP_027178468.1 GPI ethanolamine phosphate transferase 2 [Coffea eugenioides]
MMGSSSSSSSLTCKRLTILTILAVVMQITGLFLFVIGFFPVKTTLSGASGLESFYPPGFDSSDDRNASTTLPPRQLKSLYQQLSGVPPLFDRLILMVIDGLPAEFVLGKDGKPPPKVYMEAMPYTQSLLAKGKAIGYHARAAPPTVTMPRLKAMVSGAIGGYLDVALNFNTQAFLDDNLIEQFSRIGWKMVMLGDDTWLKLFPGMFTRHDGVSSFFVKDTVQVDHNVSRHLNVELNRTDWNLLILHFLGLDHVGHIGGRNSLLMGPKLKEMDEVIKMIDLTTLKSQKYNQGRTLLVVVSDHGMTENGNHGGSSYEEIDSLALFIGLGEFTNSSTTNNIANQVDIAPTLALLYGVPIPKNNVGIVMVEVFKLLTDDERLRLMELNAWQLLQLLQAQLPGLECEISKCNVHRDGNGSEIRQDYSTVEEMFCCLYLHAATVHKSMRSDSPGGDEYGSTFLAYREFLKTAGQWLSRRATDRPLSLLACGFAAMLVSCSIIMGLLFFLIRETYIKERELHSHAWQLDKTFTLAIICILMLSMGSSSMVEEEQYIWHFLTSSIFLVLLRKTLQSITLGFGVLQNSSTVIKEQRERGLLQIFSVIVVLVSGRILRGWHQGGVNWAHLPDMAKWLEQAGSGYTNALQLTSGVLLISANIFTLLFSLRSKRTFAVVILMINLCPSLMIVYLMIIHQGSTLGTTGFGATKMVQRFYAILGISTLGTVVSVPMFMLLQNSNSPVNDFTLCRDISSEFRRNLLLQGMKDSTFITGWSFIFSWCLLQLLLQQPVNSMPLLLLFIQILATMWYSSDGDAQFIEVAALYYLGMAGHFGLGNTNNLATIDVAGAFTGVSSQSTLLSGILMFMITYASPIFALLSMVLYISVKDIGGDIEAKEVDIGDLLKRNLSFPCLVPLGINSMLLIAYTVVLLLMRNHLFIWSVFSPKYLYVCATTICIFLGVSIVASAVVYSFGVLALRRS